MFWILWKSNKIYYTAFRSPPTPKNNSRPFRKNTKWPPIISTYRTHVRDINKGNRVRRALLPAQRFPFRHVRFSRWAKKGFFPTSEYITINFSFFCWNIKPIFGDKEHLLVTKKKFKIMPVNPKILQIKLPQKGVATLKYAHWYTIRHHRAVAS